MAEDWTDEEVVSTDFVTCKVRREKRVKLRRPTKEQLQRPIFFVGNPRVFGEKTC